MKNFDYNTTHPGFKESGLAKLKDARAPMKPLPVFVPQAGNTVKGS